MDVLIANWPIALIAAIVALVLLYFLLRPRQRVTLTDNAPVRPHMTGPRANAVADLAGGATASILSAGNGSPLAPASGPPDDLVLLKGIGPKLAVLLAGDNPRRLRSGQSNDEGR